MKPQTVTSAARRIAREHNNRIRCGFAGNGFLIFHRNGTGGCWYSNNACPPMLPEHVRVNMAWGRITAANVQSYLDRVVFENDWLTD